jgi:hypothetical protein
MLQVWSDMDRWSATTFGSSWTVSKGHVEGRSRYGTDAELKDMRSNAGEVDQSHLASDRFGQGMT